jgi:hypothetical protein
MEIKQGVPQGLLTGSIVVPAIHKQPSHKYPQCKVSYVCYDINVLISDGDARVLQIKIGRIVADLETWLNRNDLVIN